MSPTGSTRVAGVIGDPVRHSLSPAIHNAAFAATGLDWVFVAFEVPAGSARVAVDAMRALDLGGLSVTMPHKDAVVGALDALDADAEALGAVNCVRRDGRRLVGANTDGPGLVASLRSDCGRDPAGSRCVVLGAGGAARSAVRALAAAGAARVTVVNRTSEHAVRAAALAGVAGHVGDESALGDADLVVNATPVGMEGPDVGRLPVPAGLLGAGQLVVDLVYHPRRTALLAAAEEAGAATADGTGMLVHQAALAFTAWTGLEAPLAAMRGAVVDALG